MTNSNCVTDSVQWLREFERQHGRPLRVLHIGNIANNAYINAKFLRSVGVEAHVVSYDYEHVMATPEWEEVELLHGHRDDFFPRFTKRDLRDFRRPSWFVSGPLFVCASDIAALWGDRQSRWHLAFRLIQKQLIALTTRLFGILVGRGVYLLITKPRLFWFKVWEYFRSRLSAQIRVFNISSKHENWVVRKLSRHFLSVPRSRDYSWLIGEFDESFPLRADRLRVQDVLPYEHIARYFRDMFRYYDIVQCYATEPVHALLSGKRPYVAFEHGTLRHFTMGDAPLHRLTALAYRRADHTFITNGDCLAYAQELGIESYSPIIHPIDVEQHRQNFGDAIAALHREIDGDVILFCPTRHDWDIKGTDQFIHALPLIKQRVRGRVKMVLVEWGLQVEESKKLLKELECADNAIWKPSMCRITMIKHIRVANVVCDQMVLPVFGSTAPQTIAAGKPVIGSYVPEQTRWLIPEAAPILSAFSPEEIAEAVVQALDPEWLAEYENRARCWIDTYHHPDVVIKEHLKVYRRILNDMCTEETNLVPDDSKVAVRLSCASGRPLENG